MIDNTQNIKIGTIEPSYSTDSVGSGHFFVDLLCKDTLEASTYRLSFTIFLEWMLSNDKKLFEYTKKNYKDTNKTVSDIIKDFYELGIDVDHHVSLYFEDMLNKVDPEMMQKLLAFFTFIRKFGEDYQE